MKLRKIFVLAVFCLVSTVAFAQSPAGKWTGEMQGGRGAQPVVLDLTVNGTALTGTITLGQGMPVEITEGKVDGSKITFKAAGGGGRGGGGGGRGAGGGAPGGGGGAAAGAPPAGAPPAGAPPAGAPPAGAGGGGQGGRGGRGGGGGTFVYTATITGSEMSVTRTPDAAPGAQAGGAAPAAQPQTFTLKKG